MTIIALLLTSAFASPLNPFTGAQPAGTASVAPTAYVGTDGAFSPQTYFAAGHGLGDVNLGVFTEIAGGEVANPTFDVLPRFFVNDELAFTPRVTYTVGDPTAAVGGEVHHAASFGRFTMSTNVGYMANVGSGGDAGAAYALLAPEVFVTDAVSLYVEVDPTYDFTGAGLSAMIVPGVSATLDPAGNHAIAAGVQIPVLPTVEAPTFGAWYSVSFGLGGTQRDVEVAMAD